MSSKAFFAPFALLLKLCDPHGGDHDWDDDDDDDETVEERPLDGGMPELDCGIADADVDADVSDAGVSEDGGVIGCGLLRGLYKPGSCDELSDDVRPYAPRYPLWSDGTQKERFVFLPPNAQIDATNPDFWVYPVGTRLYKTFSISGVKLETRIIEKTEAGWTFQTFPWREDQRGVEPAVPEGRENVLGTRHDLPSEADCLRCHTRAGQDGINGFSAIQLNHAFTEYGLADLVDEDRLRGGIAGEALLDEAVVPGSPLAQDALGYMHANCGICHGGPSPRAMLGMRVRVSDREVRDTDVYKQAVNRPLITWIGPRQAREPAIERPLNLPYIYRMIAGHPDKSGIVARMVALDPENRMPPLATEIVDTQGVAVVSSWISSLQPRIFLR